MRELLLPLLFLFSIGLMAQSGCVSGQVLDENGDFLSGTTILQKGTRSGTVSDDDGQFKLCGLPDSTSLMISYTGYDTQILTLKDIKKGIAPLVIHLKVNTAQLDEVVVIAYRVPLIEQDHTTQGRTASVATVKEAPRNVGRKSKKSAIRLSNQAKPSPPSARPPAPKPAPDPVNTEHYNTITENGFIRVSDQAISTLSTDVDRASYANVRRFLNQNQLPPADAVRIEEMINYFRYTDPAPTDDKPVAMRTELTDCPWNTKARLLRLGVRAQALQEMPASNLVFLLDVSGSMGSADKLPLLVQSLQLLTESLTEKDKVSIVVYAGAAGLVLPPTAGNETATIKAALARLGAGGSTAGGKGIELAYQTARANFIENGNNRIILATDGDFNVGIRDQNELIKLIEKERESGVYLTVLGFGTDNYQEGTMQLLADRGNGNHAYIDSPAEARKVLIEEFGGTLFTVAKDVKLQLVFNPEAVTSYRLVGYENRLLNTEDFDDDTKDAAELGAGHAVTVLYEIIPSKDVQSAFDLGELRLRYKSPQGGRSKKMTQAVANHWQHPGQASSDIRWAAAVTEFGLLLRNSENKGSASWKHCLQLAQAAQGLDRHGYRAEMIELIEKAMAIKGSTR